jgi:hypothetical protein
MKPDLDTVLDIADNDEKVHELFDKYYRVTKATAEELDGLSDDQALALTALAVAHLEKEYMQGLYVLCNADDVRFTYKVRDAMKRFITGQTSQHMRDFKEQLDLEVSDE